MTSQTSTTAEIRKGRAVEARSLTSVEVGVGRDESFRLRAVRTYLEPAERLDARFEELARLATRLFGLPVAAITLVDEDQIHFRAALGMAGGSLPRSGSLCDRVLDEADGFLEVRDLTLDPRLRDLCPTAAGPQVRFYAGAALTDSGGARVGTFCVMGPDPRGLEREERESLESLARQAVSLLELERQSGRVTREAEQRRRAEAGLRAQNERLVESQQEASRLLEIAEKSRSALLSILEDEQRTGQALTRSNRALKMLSGCNEALILARDEPSLLDQVCRIAVQHGGHRMAVIAYAENDAAKTLRPVGSYGDDTGYLNEIRLTWDETQDVGRGPAGRCIRESAPMVCRDVRDPAWQFKHVQAFEARGFRSVICLPLRDEERTFGLLALYSAEGSEPDPTEIRLLRELADDIAFGITALRARNLKAQNEIALRASLREKEALLKEVHHRVKNNLQVIASLLRLEGRRIEHPITQSVLREMQGRIQSMALLHETLYRSGNFATIDLGAYLSQLARQLFRSLASAGDVTLNLDLCQAALEIDQAIPCGLIVNELASNALKHAFPAGRQGVVDIRLTRAEDGGLILRVSDDGVGLPPGFDPATTGSLGLQLVSDLARQIQGGLDIGPGPQAVFTVSFRPSGSATASSVTGPPGSGADGGRTD